jgi:hypothetical protein
MTKIVLLYRSNQGSPVASIHWVADKDPSWKPAWPQSYHPSTPRTRTASDYRIILGELALPGGRTTTPVGPGLGGEKGAVQQAV